MFALFRNNQVSTALLLAVYIAVLHLPAILGWIKPPGDVASGPALLFRDTFGWALADPLWSSTCAAVLVFIQALLVNSLADTFRMMNDRNWVPGAMYALTASCLPDFLFLSPALVGITFIPLALRRMFSVYKQSSAFAAVFDSALWLTVGSIFHPPVAWLLPVCFFSFFTLRVFNLREQIVFFTGVFSPFFIALTFYFWFDAVGAFLSGQFGQGLRIDLYSLPNDIPGMLKSGLLLVLLFIVLLGFNVYYFKKLIQVQKYISVLYWCLFAGLGAALLHGNGHFPFFVVLMPSVAIFLAYSFQALRNAFMAEVFHFGLLAAVFFIQFFPNTALAQTSGL